MRRAGRGCTGGIAAICNVLSIKPAAWLGKASDCESDGRRANHKQVNASAHGLNLEGSCDLELTFDIIAASPLRTD